MEASTIIDINNLLRKKLPNAQLSWQPSTNETKYRCNAQFDGNIENLVNTIVQYCSEQELIVLTLHDGLVYFN